MLKISGTLIAYYQLVKFMEDYTMFTKEPVSITEMHFQESFASSMRAHEVIRARLSDLIDDYSLLDEVTCDIHEHQWTN